MIGLKQLIPALVGLKVDERKVLDAIDSLYQMLKDLDEVEVKGRQNVETLLGCMMAIEAIIGKDGGNG